MPLSKSNLLYRGILFVVLIGTVLLWKTLGLSNELEVAILLALFAAWHFIFKKLNAHWSIKLDSILTHQCDPEAYIEKVKALMNDRAAQKHGQYTAMLRLRLCQALMVAGQFEDMEAQLPPMQVEPVTATQRLFAVWVSRLRISLHLHRGETDGAAAELENIRTLLDPKWIKPKILAIYQRGIPYYECVLDMALGRFEGIEERLLRYFEAADSSLNRVFAQYQLGKAYVHSGQPDNARAAFRYVTAHGNKIHAITLAREALTQLDQTGSITP